MKEIELKILNIDVEEIKKKLLGLGAKPLGEQLVLTKIFDFDDGRITKRGELFRLRKIGGRVEVAYKEARAKESSFLEAEETETEVKDFEVIEKIIERLGLKCVRYQEKKRTSFISNGLKFEIDQYPTIPAYLEIEGQPEKIKEVVELLGFGMSETTARTATEVLKSYGVDSRFQKF